MLGFTRLRLRGFKSFADQTDLDIAPGLTGIVGPNGCGKSNILEALRWVMGESSARKMRGTEMEDVIFAGTASRAAREMAHVTLTLDNAGADAPAPWTASETIEVSRAIARGQGSAFRINGRPVRARDVHVLFADSTSGAASPALVSQGHIARMMTVKPHERRQILEEAAGVAGLHARRGEAAQRLTAAEGNLAQVAQRLADMRGRAEALAKAAKQAARYRALSEEIRSLEVSIALATWEDLALRLEDAEQEQRAAEKALAARMAAAAEAGRVAEASAGRQRSLRTVEMEAGSRAERARLDLDVLEAAGTRHARDVAAGRGLLDQTRADAAHEQAALAEAEARLRALSEEAEAAPEVSEEDVSAASAEAGALESVAADAGRVHEAALSAASEARAERGSAERRLRDAARHKETLDARVAQARAAWEALQGVFPRNGSPGAAALPPSEHGEGTQALEADIAAAERTLAEAVAQAPALAAQTAALTREVQDAQDRAVAAERAAVALVCEVEALAPLVSGAREESPDAVAHTLAIEPGAEAALAAALGEGLVASLNTQDLAFWAPADAVPDIPPPALPDGARPLVAYLQEPPPALAQALAAAGVVADMSTAQALAPRLRPGQCLVTAEGGVVRWDGYTAHPGARSTDEAAKLAQRGRLAALQAQRPGRERDHAEAEQALAAAKAGIAQARKAEQALEAVRRGAEQEVAQKRVALAAAREAAARQEADRTRAKATLEEARAQMAVLEDSVARDEEALAAARAAEAEAEQTLAAAHDAVQQARDRARAAQDAASRLAQAAAGRRARAQAAADERVRLTNQAIRARGRLEALAAREAEQATALEVLVADPPDAPEAMAALESALEAAKAAHAHARAQLEAEEAAGAQAAARLKAEEEAIGTLRERRAVAAANHASLAQQRAAAARAIEGKFGRGPEALGPVQQAESVDTLTARLARRSREREALGPVNLQAEAEGAALAAEVEALAAEEGDLTQAVAELQSAIRKINKEARGRLLAAFRAVDAHFQRLFTRLFGGGQARLALIGDDPLEAGLDVLAQPPGKTLQSLTLLSGGEQTLASIALIMAMFLAQPAPLCVLDEIDAALDDANVERMCGLLEEIARRTQTRFLVITHHRLTMARMDRLYGVTMAERGVSALVSVDLQESFAFMDAA